MRTLTLLLATLLVVLFAASGITARQQPYQGLSDADIEQVLEEVLSEYALEAPKKNKLFRRASKKGSAAAKSLSDSEAGLTVTIDNHSNEFWIQLQVAPAKTVVSTQVILQSGQVFAAANADWDHGNGANFVGKPGDRIASGSRVTIRCFLRAGGQVDIPINWNNGARASSNGGAVPTTPATNPSAPTSSGASEFWKKPSSKNNLVENAINKAHAFKRSGSGPTAHITGEDDLRRRNKNKLFNACDDLGINDLKTRAMIFALFTLESEQMYYSNGEAQRDTGKDHDWLSKNYSPLNMNVDMLQFVGINKSQFEALNKIGNIKDTVHTFLVALNKLGLEGFLNFHRGGRTGYNHPNDAKFKIPAFKDGVFNILQKYIQDPSLFTDGRKVWASIPYV